MMSRVKYALFSNESGHTWVAIGLAILISVFAIRFAYPSRPTLHLIGDSTMSEKPLVGNPERGWGQALPLFFGDEVVVANHARNGRSTKSFIDEGLWDEVRISLQPGDYVLIQFGHNDAKSEDPHRFA